LSELRPNAAEAARRQAPPPLIAVLPGSRRSEIARLCDDFGAALGLVGKALGAIEIGLPTLPHIEDDIRRRVAGWPIAPRIVAGEAEKLATLRNARAALAASGTVTLELALSGVPMVGAYKVSRLEEQLKYIVKVPSILLPNLILGERAIPEILQRDCTPENLAAGLIPLIGDTPQRAAQVAALQRLDGLMQLPGGEAPSARAARLVLKTIGNRAR
jgi:lipid-A-disaccharide synthase